MGRSAWGRTHDLTSAGPALCDAAVPVYFTETAHAASADAPMSFDYRLRPGLAPSMNALRLMQLGEEGASVSVEPEESR
jgi:hypothetical protein